MRCCLTSSTIDANISSNVTDFGSILYLMFSLFGACMTTNDSPFQACDNVQPVWSLYDYQWFHHSKRVTQMYEYLLWQLLLEPSSSQVQEPGCTCTHPNSEKASLFKCIPPASQFKKQQQVRHWTQMNNASQYNATLV